jgi:mono/diheme cytochrome c family protein
MAVMKRLIIVLVVVSLPLMLGLLFTYEIIKIDWISFMEIQPVAQPQRDPLPLPARSVPVQGAYISQQLGAPENPFEANENSVARGQYFYDISCTPCHGAQGQGNGPFSAFLRDRPPSNLTDAQAVNLSDGEIFVIISNGIEGAMPPMRYNLPDEEMRWSVVNYVRSLQQAGQ